MKAYIFGDEVGYITDEASKVSVEEANLNQENREQWTTDLAAVSRGKSGSNHPASRFKKLLKEAAPNKLDADEFVGNASRPVEFLPVFIHRVGFLGDLVTYYDKTGRPMFDMHMNKFLNEVMPFSYRSLDEKLYTNFRALVNAGVDVDSIPFNAPDELDGFVAIKANIPMFVWAQVPNTHTRISKEAQSDRVTYNAAYWLPDDLDMRIQEVFESNNLASIDAKVISLLVEMKFCDTHNERVKVLLTHSGQDYVMRMFKELGYPDEISQRAMYYFRYKEVVMTGWKQDPKVWEHLLLERNAFPEKWQNWTQDITATFTNNLRKMLNL